MRIRLLVMGLALLIAGMTAAQAQYRPPGYRCDARFGTPYGRRGLVCPLVRAKPIGVGCRCVPPGPPGHGFGRPIPGHVIR